MLTGQSVYLRPLQLEDAQNTLLLRYDLEANKALMGFPFPVNLENEKNWLANLYPQGERKTIYMAICEEKSRSFTGYLSVKNIDYIDGRADFGIILLKDFRGKGYAKEAMLLFFNWLYRDFHLRKITLQVLVDNTPAIEAYKKIGFIREGILKNHTWQDGQYKSVMVMSLFLSELKGKTE